MTAAGGLGSQPDLASHSHAAAEVSEEAPLKWGAARGAGGCGGPRFIVACFGALSAAITVALLAQIYSGDYEVVPHGAVASSAAECSQAGTGALKAGGGALDAAVAAALCLAVLAPHRTGLDASGSLLLWEYKGARSQPALVAQWGGPGQPGEARPRLLAALAWLHARHGGRLPFARLLQPALDLAADGFLVSHELAASVRLAPERPLGELAEGRTLALPQLASYLRGLLHNSSRQLADAWAPRVLLAEARAARLGDWTLLLPEGQSAASAALAALAPLFASTEAGAEAAPQPDRYLSRLATSMLRLQAAGAWVPGAVAATGLSVVDSRGVYVSLVTGLSQWLGSRRATEGGWLRDDAPVAPLTPAVLTEAASCGRRYVLGAADTAALVQVVAALALADPDPVSAVERPRVSLLPSGEIGLESERLPGLPAAALFGLVGVAALRNTSEPYAGVNAVLQSGDALVSQSDSRGGGIASRF